jgi:hypothetical protein
MSCGHTNQVEVNLYRFNFRESGMSAWSEWVQ